MRLVSNVEVFALRPEKLLVPSNFLLYEWRAGETQLWSGAATACASADGCEIKVRQVNLVDCDQSLRNPSPILSGRARG